MCDRDCFNCIYDDCIVPDYETKWYMDNPGKRKEARHRYYVNHIDQEKAYQKQRYAAVKDTPEYKQMKREYMRKYRERKRIGV